MKSQTLATPDPTLSQPLAKAVAAIALALGVAGLVFLMLDVHAMRTGLDSTNAALVRTNQQLRLTNDKMDGVTSQLVTTNRELAVMRRQLDTTNARLSATNGQLRTMAGELGSMRRSLDAMTHRIVHAKLLF